MLSRRTGSDNDWVIGAEQQRFLLWNRFNKHLGGANKLNHSLRGAKTISRDDATVQFVRSLRPYSALESWPSFGPQCLGELVDVSESKQLE